MKRALLTLLATAAVGCAPQYRAITFQLRSQPPHPVQLDDEQIEISVGVAASVRAVLHSSTMIEYVDEPLDLDSQDGDVLQVVPGSGTYNFVLIGIREGETCIEVEVDFEVQECIPVRVVAPPS